MKKSTKKNSKKAGTKKVRKAVTEPAFKKTNSKMTRAESVVQAIKLLGGGSKTDILVKADELFAASGGKSNLSESRWLGGSYVLPSLTAWGVLELDENLGTFSIKQPV